MQVGGFDALSGRQVAQEKTVMVVVSDQRQSGGKKSPANSAGGVSAGAGDEVAQEIQVRMESVGAEAEKEEADRRVREKRAELKKQRDEEEMHCREVERKQHKAAAQVQRRA